MASSAHEYTAKDVATGIATVCLAYEASEINSLRFIHLLFQHLIRHGVNVRQATIQTDNGSEFLGHVQAKRPRPSPGSSSSATGRATPPFPLTTPPLYGVIENFHGRVENEFYTLEALPTEEEMLERLFGYVLYYNFGWPNEGLRMRTPVEVLQEKSSKISPDVAALPPVALDRIELSADQLLPPISGGGENRPDAHSQRGALRAE